uniref:RHS repeat protein n=1 Tax=Sphingomonas sp. URHD0057 TaxID=1380389 RepID=UPI000688D502
MIHRTSRRAFACALFATTALATPAFATPSVVPLYRNWDENNVDVVRGDFRLNFEEAAIGSGKARLAIMRQRTDAGPFQWDKNNLVRNGVSPTIKTYAPRLDGSYFHFTNLVSDAADGATMTGALDPVSGNFGFAITDHDGVVYLYSSLVASDFGPSNYCQSLSQSSCSLALSRVTYPDGSVTTVTNSTWQGPGNIYSNRVCSVSNSFGYSIAFTFQSQAMLGCTRPMSGTTASPPDTFFNRTKSSFRQNNVEQFAITYAYPVTGTVDITDATSNVWEVTATSIKKPGDASPSFSVTNGTGLVSSVTNAGVTTTYGRSVVGDVVTLTKTDPLGKATVITGNQALDRITSVKDPLNRTTSYGYNASNQLTSVTNPEGDGTDIVPDTRGNATQIKQRPKTGSASPLLITTQTFAASCTNVLTCNQPTQIKDPANNITDIAYDPTHGGVTSVTRPTPATGGVRPQTRYTYTQQTNGVYLLTKISECQTLGSCLNAADEVKTSVGYDGFGNATGLSKGNGTGTLTAASAMTYDGVGNLLTVDGPLSGTADTTRYRYDADRRLIGVTSPDPDAGGALKPRAVKTSYDGAGRVTKVERGNVNSQSDADWAAFAAAETLDVGLDANGRVKTQKLSGSGGAVALTQASYDADGRPLCSAVRMNPAEYASLPATACTLDTTGSFGPDRISKAVYDDAGQVTQVQVAVGTTDAANERTLTYSNDGDLKTLKDAENNLTTYTYDEYDRLKQTQFPSPTKGAGTSNAADFEQLGYDSRGNVISRRLRDGLSIAFGYDNLNRVKLKDLPGTEPDVSYAYDNLDRLTSATQTGNNLSFTYDALSRNLTQVGPQGTVTLGYDLANHRASIAYPSTTALTIDYAYLTTGELDTIKQGATVLADYTADNLGRRTGVTFANGASQSFGYDPVSRLASVGNTLTDANNLSATFAYNPASQITSNVRTGDTYAWTGHGNGSTASVANGLNQLSSIGGVNTTHDTKGNLTTDPISGKTFSYSSENLLTSSSGGVTLAYDPLLRLYQVAGASTTRFVYDGLDAIAEYNGSNALQRRFVFDPTMDQPVVWYEGTGTAATDRRYLSTDERGSVISVSDSSGASLGLNTYDEFGKPGASNIGRFQYTGQAWIPELAL